MAKVLYYSLVFPWLPYSRARQPRCKVESQVINLCDSLPIHALWNDRTIVALPHTRGEWVEESQWDFWIPGVCGLISASFHTPLEKRREERKKKTGSLIYSYLTIKTRLLSKFLSVDWIGDSIFMPRCGFDDF